MNEVVYESCVNCANINNCSGPDYIDGSWDPGFKPKDQSENKKDNNINSEVLNERRKWNNMERYSWLWRII